MDIRQAQGTALPKLRVAHNHRMTFLFQLIPNMMAHSVCGRDRLGILASTDAFRKISSSINGIEKVRLAP